MSFFGFRSDLNFASVLTLSSVYTGIYTLTAVRTKWTRRPK